MNYAQKLVRGTIVIFFMSLLAAFFGYLLRVFLARNLTAAEYGLFYAVFGFLGIFALFKDFGLGQALAKKIPDFLVKKDYKKIKSAIISSLLIQFISSTIVSIVLVFFAKYLSESYFKSPVAYPVFLLAIAMYWISLFESTYSGIFQGFQKMKYFSMIPLLRMILILVLVFILFFFQKSIVFVGLSYVLYHLISIFLYFPFFKKTFPNFSKIKAGYDWGLSKELLNFGVPMVLATVGWSLLGYVDTAILTLFRSLEEVGYYNIAMPTVSLLFYFPIAISSAILPIISEMWTRKHSERLKNGLNIIYKYSLAFITPFILIMFLFPDVIINILFGAKYINAASALRILSIGVFFYTIAYINLSILAGIGKPKKITVVVLSAALFNFIGNFLLIPRMGIDGAAIMTTLGFLMMMVWSFVYLSKNIRPNIDHMFIFKIGFSAILFLLTVYLIKMLVFNYYIKIAIACAVSLSVYFVFCLILKIIVIKDIKEFILSK